MVWVRSVGFGLYPPADRVGVYLHCRDCRRVRCVRAVLSPLASHCSGIGCGLAELPTAGRTGWLWVGWLALDAGPVLGYTLRGSTAVSADKQKAPKS